MFLPNSHSFLLIKSETSNIFLPNSQSFLLVRSAVSKQVIQSGIAESATSFPSFSSSDSGKPTIGDKDKRNMFLPNSHSFLLVRSETSNIFLPNSQSFLLARSVKPVIQFGIQESATSLPSSSLVDSGQPTIGDKDKRNFLKVAGIAGAGLAAFLLLPKKADAFIMGSSPTTGVVGVKNAANTRINPATEETLGTVLKKTDLAFDTGDLKVKVTSLPAGGSSFSDSAGVAKSGLVNASRNVQVDVLSSALPSSASTETTLQTISFGGFKFIIRLETVGTIDYVGEAAVGTATSAALWRIKRLDNTTGIIIQWASGTAVFDKIWDNRTAYTYS